jgi:hypothetical protein
VHFRSEDVSAEGFPELSLQRLRVVLGLLTWGLGRRRQGRYLHVDREIHQIFPVLLDRVYAPPDEQHVTTDVDG